MSRTKAFFRRLRTPVTILMIPHGQSRPIHMQVPVFVLLMCFFLCVGGTFFLADVSVRAIEYRRMEARLSYISAQFREMKDVMLYLRQAEQDFRKMFGVKSKTDILKAEDAEYSGSFDMKALRERLDESMKSVVEIQDYIREQKDIYRATPAGWPLSGHVSSGYGFRNHPVHDEPRLHTGMDISVPTGTEVKATADGIIAFADWTEGGGSVVIIEHGHGFRTAYVHNSKALVQVGQHIKRGDAIALSGSTGISTGPHLHYEVWKNGQHVNPASYLKKEG